ncbi:MAG: hypothetical protein N2445_07975, partial [Acidobacteria bacterium]|nr:hypothetical protein [Acidobacteriota bacterium]
MKKEKVEINPNGVMKTKAEMDEVWRRINKIRLVFGLSPLYIFLVLIIFEIAGIIWFNKRLGTILVSFMEKHQILALLLLIIACVLFEYSKFNREYIEVLRVPYNRVAKPYKKAEEDIIYGIQRERLKWVERGVERLEGLSEYLSEMPEHNKLLEEGKNWLKEYNQYK